MTWEAFSLGGVSANITALHTLRVDFEPVLDVADIRREPTGEAHVREHWRKQRILLAGSGIQPLSLSGVDYSGSLTLTLTPRGGTPVNYTVLARPPSIGEDRIRSAYTWTLECEEVNATVLHSLPFTFSIGGVSPHELAQLDFNQQIEPLVGGGIVRMGSGTGEKREHWRKNRISLSGGGWVPLNGLDALTYSGPLTLSISRLNTIDGNGNPSYTTTNYSVLTDGPVHDWDMVNRLYTWSLDCEEA